MWHFKCLNVRCHNVKFLNVKCLNVECLNNQCPYVKCIYVKCLNIIRIHVQCINVKFLNVKCLYPKFLNFKCIYLIFLNVKCQKEIKQTLIRWFNQHRNKLLDDPGTQNPAEPGFFDRFNLYYFRSELRINNSGMKRHKFHFWKSLRHFAHVKNIRQFRLAIRFHSDFLQSGSKFCR